MRRCRRRFVGLPGGCDFIVSDSILARNPGRSSGPHLWRAGSCGLRVVQNPRPSPISVFRGCFHSRSVSPVAFSPRRLSWLRINRPVARPTASLDTERGVSAYSGGFPPLELTPFPGRNWTLRVTGRYSSAARVHPFWHSLQTAWCPNIQILHQPDRSEWY